MNINTFVKNNCCIKNTEMIFILYIPSWDIHNIKVKLELALPQQSEYSALSYTKLCNTHPSYRMIPFSEYDIFIFLFRLVQSFLLNCNSYPKIYWNVILDLHMKVKYGGQVSCCNISWDRSYNSTKGSEQEDEDAIFKEWNHSIRRMWQKSVIELRI